jgi:hypothetical protein
MKFYCENCETKFEFPDTLWVDTHEDCPICGYPGYPLIPIPDYETPSQHKRHTGKPVGDDTAVWYSHPYEHIDPHTKQKTGRIKYTRWLLADYHKVKQMRFMAGLGGKPWRIVIADPPVPPPDGWVPEVNNDPV